MLFLSSGLYGPRKLTHFAAYKLTPTWWFVEAGPFTLEVDTTKPLSSRRSKVMFAFGIALPSPFAIFGQLDGWLMMVARRLLIAAAHSIHLIA